MSMSLTTLSLLEAEAHASADAPLAQRLRQAVHEHYDFVWRCVRRLGVDEGDACDATQRVFLVLAERLASVEPDRLRPFLFGVAARVATNERRAQRARRGRLADGALTESLAASDPTPEEQLDRRQARALLDTLLDGLDDDLRAVLVLVELEHLTLPEAAATLELPLGTATSRLRRAREQMTAAAKRMRARGGGVT